jgi:hypothetical protein
MRNYLSFGGGVNSVALHLLMIEQGIEFESVFVHHGTDWPETYQYVAGFQWWLKANGHKPITVLFPSKKHKTVLAKCEAYSMVPHMRTRWCTVQFKIDVCLAYYQKPCFQFIGFSTDEAKRARISIDAGVENRWPLLEHEISREGCKKIIAANDLPIPMKSGCFICPMQRISQWKQLRRVHPDLFCKAQQLEKANMDNAIKKGKKPMTLHSSGRLLASIVNEAQTQLFEQDEYPPCQCFV